MQSTNAGREVLIQAKVRLTDQYVELTDDLGRVCERKHRIETERKTVRDQINEIDRALERLATEG